jgi:hypothetical protein
MCTCACPFSNQLFPFILIIIELKDGIYLLGFGVSCGTKIYDLFGVLMILRLDIEF